MDDKLNGPSYPKSLFSTGRIENFTVSWQLTDWGSLSFTRGSNFTLGGHQHDSYFGALNFNFILATSPWLWNLNYQGLEYQGGRVPRNKTFIYGSVDPMAPYLGVPEHDYIYLYNMWRLIPRIWCAPPTGYEK